MKLLEIMIEFVEISHTSSHTYTPTALSTVYHVAICQTHFENGTSWDVEHVLHPLLPHLYAQHHNLNMIFLKQVIHSTYARTIPQRFSHTHIKKRLVYAKVAHLWSKSYTLEEIVPSSRASSPIQHNQE